MAATRSGSARAVDDLDALLRLRARGDRPAPRDRGRLRAGRRGPHGRAAGRPRLGLRRRLGALRRRRSPSTCAEFDVWASRRVARPRVAALLRAARRGRADRDVRRHGPPGPRQGLGPRAARRPRATRGSSTRSRSRGWPRAASPSRSRRPGCASRWGSSTRPARSWRWRWRRAARWRSRATPTRPEDLGRDYDHALALLEDLGVTEVCLRPRVRASSRRATRASLGARRPRRRR